MLRRANTTDSAPAHGAPVILARPRRFSAWVLALALPVLTFAALEVVTPYGFAQDDNRDFFLPLYEHNVRALAHGELATYNFYQSLGTPHLSNGQAATLHPLPYLAAFLSRLTLGHDFAAIDVLALLYLLIAAAGCLFLSSTLRLSIWPFALLVASMIASPTFSYAARSWIHCLALLAATPWSLGFTLRLVEGRSARLLAGKAATLAFLFYVGYPQWLLLLLVLEAIAFTPMLLRATLSPGASRSILARVATESMLVLAVFTTFCLPLLLPMWSQMARSSTRSQALHFGEFASQPASLSAILDAWVWPWQRLWAQPRSIFVDVSSPPSFLHPGWLVLLLCLLGLGAWSRQGRGLSRGETFGLGCLCAGGFGVLWATGALSFLFFHVPIFNRFRWPFKSILPASLFLIVGAAIVAESLLRRSKGTQRLLAIAVVAQIAVLLLLSARPTVPAFLEHRDSYPFSQDWGDGLREGRVVTLGYGLPNPPFGLHSAPALGFNYATLFRVFHFGGYEPLRLSLNERATLGLDHVSSLNVAPEAIPVDYLRLWGTRWYVVHPLAAEHYRTTLEERGLVRRSVTTFREVFEDPLAEPLASATADCTVAQPGVEALGVNSLRIRVRCLDDGILTLRFLANPFLEFLDDSGENVLSSDPLGRIVLPLMPGDQTIMLRYRDPWLAIGVLSCALAMIVWAGWTLLQRVRSRPAVSVGRRAPSATAGRPASLDHARERVAP
ncbi:MAG TPA: hypothetical protein VMV46_21635 [Thermoanaerobaculia bacterium]|nr:hypothetical protein [Thermoanaerobaculia bacterium]